jgi:hypothetical protein
MSTSSSQRAALVIGHPGHELRVLGWVHSRQPVVLVLTDGAGHGEESRTDLSRSLAVEAGAICGDMFGQVPDQRLYRAILEQNFDFFLDLSDRLAESLEHSGADWIAGDSIEGYNPTHDLCRWVIDRAVRMVKDRTGRDLANFQFPLVGHPAAWASRPGAFCHRLEDDALKRKVAIVRRYAKAAGGVLVAEVEDAIATFGEQIFAQEWFSPASAVADSAQFETNLPAYERHGEERVAAGHYQHVIRYKEHIANIAHALQAHGPADRSIAGEPSRHASAD